VLRVRVFGMLNPTLTAKGSRWADRVQINSFHFTGGPII